MWRKLVTPIDVYQPTPAEETLGMIIVIFSVIGFISTLMFAIWVLCEGRLGKNFMRVLKNGKKRFGFASDIRVGDIFVHNDYLSDYIYYIMQERNPFKSSTFEYPRMSVLIEDIRKGKDNTTWVAFRVITDRNDIKHTENENRLHHRELADFIKKHTWVEHHNI